MLLQKKILLGVTGSIAAYKSASLIRLLVKAGAEVKVIMTPAAAEFISPLTLGTLSRNEVLLSIATESNWANHVMLGRWADIMLLAPLSCNSISKMAAGACDNLLLAVYLSATCPVVLVPAMDEDMWQHPATRRNIQTLQAFGHHVIDPGNGELASGLYGEGRMAEPEQIVAWLNRAFISRQQLADKHVLVTAGPTHEAIDPVRFIGNSSSGKMGLALAKELQRRGASVTLVMGPGSEPVPANIHCVHVTTAREMYEASISVFDKCDWAIMSAAVADFTPKHPAHQKLKKNGVPLVLELEKTIDILAALGSSKMPHQCVVGFALETENEQPNALKKLTEKRADMIVLNSLNDSGVGFGKATNKVTIFDAKGGEHAFDTKSKEAVAADIIDTIIGYTNE